MIRTTSDAQPDTDARRQRRDRPATRLMLGVAGVVVVLVAASLIGARLTDDKSRDRGAGVTVGEVHADRIRIRVNGVRSVRITPLRAGDLITLRADVTTTGDASRWVRTRIDLSKIDPDLARHVSVYAGVVPTGVALKAAMDITDPITFPGYLGNAEATPVVTTQAYALNGRSELAPAGVSPYKLAFAVYVDPATPERLLGRTMAVSAVVETTPYQDRPEPPADDQWDDGPRLPLV